MANLRIIEIAAIDGLKQTFRFTAQGTPMTETDKNQTSPKDKRKAEKDARLAQELRSNLRRRKSRQRDRGDAPPAAIKNTDRLTD